MSLKSVDFNRGGLYLFSKSRKPNENARVVLLVYEGPVPAAVKGSRLMMFRSATGTWKECFTEAQLKDYKIEPKRGQAPAPKAYTARRLTKEVKTCSR